MTMSSSVSKVTLNGDGVQTTWPFSFKVWKAGDLEVSITSPAGANTVVTDWTVELGESGGTVTYPITGYPLPLGWKITIRRSMDFLQEVDLVSGTRWDPEVVETALDQAAAERQQLLEEISRSVRIGVASTENPENVVAEIFYARQVAEDSASAAQEYAGIAVSSMDAAALSETNAARSEAAAALSAGTAEAEALLAAGARDAAILKAEEAAASLSALRGEVDGARLGHSTLALAMQDLAQRVADLIEVQNAITMGQVAVYVGRVPSPNDDVYPPGFTWVYPGTNDFWVCVHVAPGAARWRRSDGELTRRLVKPSVQVAGSARTFQEVPISLGNADSERLEVEWDATGSPVVVSGDLSGSDSTAITLQWAGAGEYTVRARVRGDGTVLHHSFWSDIRAVLVGTSIYCGSGAYCGDGSHAGAMIS